MPRRCPTFRVGFRPGPSAGATEGLAGEPPGPAGSREMTDTERTNPAAKAVGRSLTSAAAIAVLALLVAMLAIAKEAHAASWSVEADGIVAWAPGSLKIDPGDDVTWDLRGEEFHDVMITRRPTSDLIAKSPTGTVSNHLFSWTFEEEGNYDYICTLHPGMDGSLTVGDPPSPGPAPSPAKLSVAVSPIKMTARAKAKQVKVKVTTRNVGERPTIAPVDACVTAPAKRFTVKGGVCKPGAKLGPGAQSVKEFVLRIKKGARGKKTKVGVSAASAGLATADASTTITVKKAKKKGTRRR